MNTDAINMLSKRADITAGESAMLLTYMVRHLGYDEPKTDAGVIRLVGWAEQTIKDNPEMLEGLDRLYSPHTPN